ncbi:hypothetical protein BDQ17DRAFT_1423535 [Cyathus striatus]|nr:hypothetical protein BDQ17DRAFT_1423535 [Cyathus striatus]
MLKPQFTSALPLLFPYPYLLRVSIIAFLCPLGIFASTSKQEENQAYHEGVNWIQVLILQSSSGKSVVEAEPKPSKAAVHHRAADQLASSESSSAQNQKTDRKAQAEHRAWQALEKELARDKLRAEQSIAVKQESTELEQEFRLFPELELSAEQRQSETVILSPEKPLFPFVSRPSVNIGSILIPRAFEDAEHEYTSKPSGELADLLAFFRQFTFGSPKYSTVEAEEIAQQISNAEQVWFIMQLLHKDLQEMVRHQLDMANLLKTPTPGTEIDPEDLYKLNEVLSVCDDIIHNRGLLFETDSEDEEYMEKHKHKKSRELAEASL